MGERRCGGAQGVDEPGSPEPANGILRDLACSTQVT